MATTKSLVKALDTAGLLLLQDPSWPSVAALVAGEPIKGSWWGHKAGKEIFRLVNELDTHADVLLVKLLAKKVTLVHRRLWPELLAVVTAREPWQMKGLPPAAQKLLATVDKDGEAHADGAPTKFMGERMVVFSRQEHTDAGHHGVILESWAHWASRRGPIAPVDVAAAKRALADLVAEGNARYGTKLTIPWPSK